MVNKNQKYPCLLLFNGNMELIFEQKDHIQLNKSLIHPPIKIIGNYPYI